LTTNILKAVNEINKDGFTVLRKLYNYQLINKILYDVKTFKYEVHPNNIANLNKNKNTIYNIQYKFPETLFLISKNKILLEILKNQLNDQFYGKIKKEKANFILRGSIARTEDKSGLPWHIDSFVPFAGLFPWIMAVTIPLEKYTKKNGCFRVIKGSHHFGQYVSQKPKGEIIEIEANPGDVIVWNGGIWHQTGPNTTRNTRWSIISTFCRWWIKPSFNHSKTIPNELFNQLTKEELTLLDYYANIPEDEQERADLKSGY